MTGDEIDKVVEQRIRGRSVRAIAKALGTTAAEVNKASTFGQKRRSTTRFRKRTLALELARLDELQEVFHARALQGNVQCGALVTKIIERRGTMLGLHTPQTAVLQIVDSATPRETSTDKIEPCSTG